MHPLSNGRPARIAGIKAHVALAIPDGRAWGGRSTWETGGVIGVGVVRDFRPEEGWGTIDGPDVPGGCWVHFSTIVEGYRQLTPGQRVSFRAEATNQDGFKFRATKVWPDGVEPTDRPAGQGSSIAYRSSLILTFDQGEGPGIHQTP
jgi:cold shock protein